MRVVEENKRPRCVTIVNWKPEKNFFYQRACAPRDTCFDKQCYSWRTIRFYLFALYSRIINTLYATISKFPAVKFAGRYFTRLNPSPAYFVRNGCMCANISAFVFVVFKSDVRIIEIYNSILAYKPTSPRKSLRRCPRIERRDVIFRPKCVEKRYA